MPDDRGTALGECPAPLASSYDASLYDLDGVLYLGEEPVEHAAASVVAAAALGLRAAFVTNNASRRPGAVAEHLRRLGVPAVAEDVVTSAQAAVRWLIEHVPRGSAVLVLGTDDLAADVADGGFRPVRTADEAPAAVVQGLARTTAWTDLAEACVALQRGALWVAGNADSTYPSTRGALPGNGAMVAALAIATGRRPVVVGKPELELHRESLLRAGADRPLVVGDRLDTDVLGAVRGGTDSLLVLTGVTDRAGLVAAPRGSRPTFVGEDLRSLLEPQPPVVVREDEARCAGAVVRCDAVGGLTTVSGAGVPELRAACALAWNRADTGA